MANELRTRDGLPFNFVDGLRIKGVDVTNWDKVFIDQGASYVGFTPVGNLAASNVQAAIAELESEKLAKVDLVTQSANGVMSATDKAKLDNLATSGLVATATNLRPGANQGVVWDNDAFGGTQDTASITLETASGEATKMRFKMTNDSDDNFEFTAKTADGLTAFNNAMTLNGNVLLNAANYVDYAAPMITNYTALRAYTGNASQIRITSNGLSGFFYYDAVDTTSADNGGTIIVSGNGKRWKRIYSELVNVAWFGAKGAGSDESSSVNAAIAAHNTVYIPSNLTITCKNIMLYSDTVVRCDGTLRLPNNCSDFDRLLYADAKNKISLSIKSIDGNYSGQTGNIGTHLIYLTNCNDVKVYLEAGKDHYVASAAPMPSADGYRNTSSGAIFLAQCRRAIVNVDLFEGWGRECVYLIDCSHSTVGLGHAQGKYITEYSGIQVGGFKNKITHASVDSAGASAVGFDTRYGNVSNIIATNTRAASGLNMGHPGRPATGSTATNIVIDGAFGGGISVAAGSIDVAVSNFYVKDVGDRGVAWEGDTVRGRLSNGVIANAARYNLTTTNGVQVQTSNVTSSDKDPVTLLVDAVAGSFIDGETVSGSGGNGTIRKIISNLTGNQSRLFVTGPTGLFIAGGIVTGSSSGATATVNAVYVPVQYQETSGGLFMGDPRYYPGTGNQVRFPDGTAIYTRSIALVYSAANANQDLTITFASNVAWSEAPLVTAFIGSGSGTSTYTINRLTGVATTTDITLTLNASFAQTYSLQITAFGRWKS